MNILKNMFNYKIFLFFLFLSILGVVLVFNVVSDSYFSLDETVYHLMAKNIWDGDLFHISNGYDIFPFDSMTLGFLRVYNGELSAQYPILYPLISAPIVSFLGIKGLVIVSILAHIFSMFSLYKISNVFIKNNWFSLFVSLIYGITTFALEYALSAFSHSLSTAFLLFSVFFLIRKETLKSKDFFIAGCFVGFAFLTRLDGILLLVAMAVWGGSVYKLSVAIKNGFFIFLGVFPFLTVLTVFNYIKFGIANPFSYGPYVVKQNVGYDQISAHLPLLLVVLFAVIFSILYRNTRLYYSSKSINFSIIILVLIFIATLFLALESRLVVDILKGFLGLFLDMRFLGIVSEEPAMEFGFHNTITYYGVMKKSLIESLPILSIGVFYIFFINKKSRYDSRLFLMWLSALFLTLPFVFLGWHGGLSFNQRYFVSILPFLTFLSLYVLKDFLCSVKERKFLIYGWLTFFSIILMINNVVLNVTNKNEFLLEFIGSVLPLTISIVLCVMVLFYKNLFRGTISFLIGGAIAIGCISTYSDIKNHLYILDINENIAGYFSDYMNEKTVLITPFNGAYYKLFKEGVIITRPTINDYRDIPEIVDVARDKGFNVMLITNDLYLDYLRKNNKLDEINICVKESNITPYKFRIYLYELQSEHCS